jgi:hypothetical protein
MRGVRSEGSFPNFVRSFAFAVDVTVSAHLPSQDILTSEHHNLINPDTSVASASENCRGSSTQ